MASESSDERGLTVSLPGSLDEWLDAKATELDVDRETVVVQLLAAYRAAGDFDDGSVGSLPVDVEDEVRDVIAERLSDIAAAVEERIDTGDVDAVEDSLRAELSNLERDVDAVEDDFQSKLEDVRQRVVQVKRETDGKAPADHTHDELEDVAALSAEVSDLADRIDDLAAAVEGGADEREDLAARVDDLEGLLDRVEDAEEKLRTVAWVVSDLRDSVEAGAGSSRAVDALKRSAAEKDVDRAICDSCEKPVDIALLTDPNCPHCEATVNDVELPGGFFGKPRLTVAKQLEAGDDADEHADSDVPDAARRNS